MREPREAPAAGTPHVVQKMMMVLAPTTRCQQSAWAQQQAPDETG